MYFFAVFWGVIFLIFSPILENGKRVLRNRVKKCTFSQKRAIFHNKRSRGNVKKQRISDFFFLIFSHIFVEIVEIAFSVFFGHQKVRFRGFSTINGRNSGHFPETAF